jgi:outer membrane protein assembly factor BamB
LNGTGDSILYSLDTTTGLATLIGNTGLPYPGIGAMVFVDGTMYATYGYDNSIYTLNTTTGEATYLEGVTGLAAGNYIIGMAQLPSDVPEPATLTLLATGLAVISRRRHRADR